MSLGIEIERKYIIYKPDFEEIRGLFPVKVFDITQTYLESADGSTHRVRRTVCDGRVEYIENEKRRIDSISAYEKERYINEQEYGELLRKRLTGSRDIVKKRYVFFYKEQKYEIDVYPEWDRLCILETELAKRDKLVEMPPFIKLYAEVSGRKEYSNMSMSLSFPKEPTE